MPGRTMRCWRSRPWPAESGRPARAGAGDLAVADGDFALVEIFNAKREAESARELLEFEDFAAIGFFVDAMDAAGYRVH